MIIEYAIIGVVVLAAGYFTYTRFRRTLSSKGRTCDGCPVDGSCSIDPDNRQGKSSDCSSEL